MRIRNTDKLLKVTKISRCCWFSFTRCKTRLFIKNKLFFWALGLYSFLCIKNKLHVILKYNQKNQITAKHVAGFVKMSIPPVVAFLLIPKTDTATVKNCRSGVSFKFLVSRITSDLKNVFFCCWKFASFYSTSKTLA